MNETIEHSKLGKLIYQEGPEQIHCWHGELEDSELGFDIILETSKLDQANVDFIAKIIQNWKAYEEKALADLREKLILEPELFGSQNSLAYQKKTQSASQRWKNCLLDVHSLHSMKTRNGLLSSSKTKWASANPLAYQ